MEEELQTKTLSSEGSKVASSTVITVKMTSMTPEKLKCLFEDLGKPTMRGVRKCPKCGTLNGTRGISCKNKNCDVVFKEKEKRKGHSADAVKVITGSTVQVFSVRLRDRGPDYRGFVQLPLVQDLDGNPAENVDSSILASAARCYVDTCGRSYNSTLHVQSPPCPHIKAAIACSEEAIPLTLKNSVLNSLQVSNEMKQAIWVLATETTGPLVQRVTKNIMVVKCKPNAKQALGFLHFSFFETVRNRSQPEYRFHCTCKAFKSIKAGMVREDNQKRCVHFYACICAFASDDGLSEEFSYYISLDSITAPDNIITVITAPEDDDEYLEESVDAGVAVSTIETLEEEVSVSPDVGAPSIEVIVDEEVLLSATEPKRRKTEDGVPLGGADVGQYLIDEEVLLPVKQTKTENLFGGADVVQASSALLTLQENALVTTSTSTVVTSAASIVTTTPKKHSASHSNSTSVSKSAPNRPTNTPKKSPLDEEGVLLSFREWLASVTERVNQTMHYQFNGNPEPLVFHAPQKFFDCLQQRISAGSKKKRLPNSTTGFVRKDALPLGTFTKYTWHITSIFHVKQIFDTPEMALEITRSFVENRDGTFDLYEAPRLKDSGDSTGAKHQTPIRPFELKTYLKVGVTSPEQKDPTPFIIEWIPDILPKCRIGELRIKFEYGHQRNGQIENRPSTAGASGVDVQTIHIQPAES